MNHRSKILQLSLAGDGHDWKWFRHVKVKCNNCGCILYWHQSPSMAEWKRSGSLEAFKSSCSQIKMEEALE